MYVILLCSNRAIKCLCLQRLAPKRSRGRGMCLRKGPQLSHRWPSYRLYKASLCTCPMGARLSLADNLSEDSICFGLAAGQGRRRWLPSPSPRAGVRCGMEAERGSSRPATRQDEDPSPHSLHSLAKNRLPWALKEAELWGKKVFTYAFDPAAQSNAITMPVQMGAVLRWQGQRKIKHF